MCHIYYKKQKYCIFYFNLYFRHLLNLQSLDSERTHQKQIKLEGEYKSIECFILLTISGTSMNTVYDVDKYEKVQYQRSMQTKYVSIFIIQKRFRFPKLKIAFV